MKRPIITSAFLLCSLLSHSQEKEETPTQLKYSWGGKFHLVDDNGLRVKSKLNKNEMYELLGNYQAGKDLYGQFQKANTLSKVFTWTGAGVIVGGAAIMIAGIDFDEGEIKEDTFIAGLGVIGGGLVLEGLGIGFGISAKVKGYKLSDGYNKYQEKYSLNFGPTKHGIGLTFKF